jgi:hypothetical protein
MFLPTVLRLIGPVTKGRHRNSFLHELSGSENEEEEDE